MAEKTRTQLKAYFESGDKPTEAQFGDLIDSIPNFADEFATKYKEIAVSSAELLAINTSPKELVVAPGSGKILVPVIAVVKFTYGTSAYATNTSLEIRLNTGSEIIDFSSLITQTSNFIMFKGLGNLTGNQPENKALHLYEPTGDPTAGDGILTIHLWYKELTL